MNFKEFILTDRESRNKEKFEGTFIDYLELVKANPDIAQLSHKRLYERIMSEGVEVLKGDENPKIRKIYGNETIKRYGFFKDDFYGMWSYMSFKITSLQYLFIYLHFFIKL